MRSRTSSEPPVVGTHRNYKNGVLQTKSAATTMSEFSSTMSDFVTPNFRERMERGEILINPCSMAVDQRTTTGSGSVTQVQNASPYAVWTATGTGTITGYYDDYGGGLPSYSEAPIPTLIEQVEVAKQKCIATIDSTPFSFAEDLAEIRETLRFLRDPLSTIRRLSFTYKKLVKRLKNQDRFRRSAKAHAKAIANDLSSVWLEQRFAVMPIFRSVLQLMEAYETEKVYRPERRTSRGIVEAPSKSDSRIVTKVSSGRTFTYRCSASSFGSVRAGIIYEVSNPIVNLQYKYGLRFKDIPETFWAVMPLSFMVDRFYNISNFIGGAVNLLDPNVDILGAWVTTKRERTVSIGVRSILESGYTSTIVPDDIVDRHFEYQRTEWEPTFADTVPNLELRGLVDSAAKTTDLLALIIQNFRS
jgi:hypothetical protein